MIFTAYLDESDSHGPTPDLVMSAFLGTARQWDLFERKIKRLQREEGFQILHAKHFRTRSGPFSGWSDDKFNRVGSTFLSLLADGLTGASTVVLPHAVFQGYLAPPSPPKMRLDSQYGLCFRMCLLHLIDQLLVEGEANRLHVVIEDGHKNVGDTLRVFGEIRDALSGLGVDFLRTMIVAKKEQALPLMAADFNAHMGALDHRNGDFDREGDAAHKRDAFHTRILAAPDYVQGIKANWADRKAQQIETWRAARGARHVSSSRGRQPS